jgi:hypothetical protein
MAANMPQPPGYPDHFELKPGGGWTLPVPPKAVEFDDPDDKKAFGIELAKLPGNPLQAANNAFPNENEKALWASRNWLNEPIVIAAKDAFLNVVNSKPALLDKDGVCAELLEISRTGFGEIKDRVAALKLYAEIQGFVGKAANQDTNGFKLNELTIKFVQAQPVETKIIEAVPLEPEKVSDDNSPVKLKLVSAR